MTEQWTRAWEFEQSDLSGLSLRAENHSQTLTLVNNLEASAVRLRFSNVKGTAPLSLSSVTVRATGANPSERIPILVDGRGAIVIAAGAESVSDPVELQLKPNDDLVIEVRVEGSVSVANVALLVNTALVALETEGPALTADSSDSPQLAQILQYVGTLYGIDRVEVLAAPARGVVFFGDSITQTGVWTDAVAAALHSGHPGGIFATTRGLGGRRLLHDSPVEMFGLFGTAAVDVFENDVFAAGAPSLVVIQIGVNDLVHPVIYGHPDELVTAGQMQDGLAALAKNCTDRGVPVLCCTILPFGGNPAWTEAAEGIRQQVNSWIRSSPDFDGVLDFDIAVRDSADPTRLASEYHAGDWLHPNSTGGAKMAESVSVEFLAGFIDR